MPYINNEIFLVTEVHCDGEFEPHAFTDYSAATAYFVQKIGQFFLDCVHDAKVEDSTCSDFLSNNYGNYFALNDGYGNTINDIPSEESFYSEHGFYLQFVISEDCYLELQIIPYN